MMFFLILSLYHSSTTSVERIFFKSEGMRFIAPACMQEIYLLIEPSFTQCIDEFGIENDRIDSTKATSRLKAISGGVEMSSGTNIFSYQYFMAL